MTDTTGVGVGIGTSTSASSSLSSLGTSGSGSGITTNVSTATTANADSSDATITNYTEKMRLENSIPIFNSFMSQGIASTRTLELLAETQKKAKIIALEQPSWGLLSSHLGSIQEALTVQSAYRRYYALEEAYSQLLRLHKTNNIYKSTRASGREREKEREKERSGPKDKKRGGGASVSTSTSGIGSNTSTATSMDASEMNDNTPTIATSIPISSEYNEVLSSTNASILVSAAALLDLKDLFPASLLSDLTSGGSGGKSTSSTSTTTSRARKRDAKQDPGFEILPTIPNTNIDIHSIAATSAIMSATSRSIAVSDIEYQLSQLRQSLLNDAHSRGIDITTPYEPLRDSSGVFTSDPTSLSGNSGGSMPLTYPTIEDQIIKLADLRHSASISPFQLPSIAFTTLLNSNDGCTSLTLGPHMSFIAAGLTNGSIRVWELGKMNINLLSNDGEKILKKAISLQNKQIPIQQIIGSWEAEYRDQQNAQQAQQKLRNTTTSGRHGIASTMTALSAISSMSSSTPISTLTSGSTVGGNTLNTTTTTSALQSVKPTNEGYYVLPAPGFEEVWPSIASAKRLQAAELHSQLRTNISSSTTATTSSASATTISNDSTLKPSSFTNKTRDVLSFHQASSFIHDATAPVQLHCLQGHKCAVTTVSISPNSRYLLSGGDDGTVRLWLLSTMSVLYSHQAHQGPIWCSIFLSKYHYLTGGLDGRICLWSVDKTVPLRIYTGHIGSIVCLSIHPNMNYFASGGSDGTIRVWSLTSTSQVRLFTQNLHSKIRCVEFSPCGTLLAVGTDDSVLCIYNLPLSTIIWSINGALTFPLSSIASPQLLSVLDPEIIKFYNNTGYYGVRPSCIHGTSHIDAITSITFSNDGQLIATTSLDNSIKVWSVKNIHDNLLIKGRIHPLNCNNTSAATVISLVPIENGIGAGAGAGAGVDGDTSRMSDNTGTSGLQQNSYSTTNMSSASIPASDIISSYDDVVDVLKNHLCGTFYTKNTTVWKAQFTSRNLLMAAGVFLNPTK